MQAYALFRVDANKTIGSGHVMRMLILANALYEKGFRIYFLYRQLPETFIKNNPSFSFVPLHLSESEKEGMVQFIHQLPEDAKKIIIIDSDLPEFYEKDFQLSVRATGSLLMMVTFFSQYHFFADIILNQNIRAPLLDYSKEDYTRELLGTSYVILKPEFQKIATKGISFKEKENNVLLFFGGADANDSTSQTLDLINQTNLPLQKIIVVIGLMYHHNESLEKVIQQSPYQIERYQNTPFMPQLMAQSKYAITSGGLTLWELAVTKTLCMTIPSSKREEITCDYLHKNKLIYNLGNDFLQKSIKNKTFLNTIFEEKQDHELMVNNFHKKIAADGTSKIVNRLIEVLEQ